MGAWSQRPALVACFVFVVATAAALLLAAPAATVTTKYLPELFGLLDGAYRVVSGEVPSRDFHTVLGPLVSYLPAAGLRLSGHLGGAAPIGMALFVLILAPAIAHVVGSRLRPALALPFAAFLILILAVPINLGESVTSLSFAYFYNRVGWTALATLLLMYLAPRAPGGRQELLDAGAAALLLLVMLYTKATYAAVGLVFVAMMLLEVGQRRWAALALVVTLAFALLVEALWRGSAAYLSDLLRAGRISGGLRGSWGQVADHLLRNLADFVLFGLIAGLSLWRTRNLGDLLFYLFCAVAGFWVINQNTQTWGIIALYAGAAVAAEKLMRASGELEYRGSSQIALGAPLFLLGLVLPTIIHCLAALLMHAGLATTRAGEDLGLPNLDRIRLAHLWTWGEHDLATGYLATVSDGARALAELDPKPGHVVVLDPVNPFSATLGLSPSRGDALWLRWGRTIDAANFVSPEQLLGDARVVLEPKGAETADATASPDPGPPGLRRVYGTYLAANFEPLRETAFWRVHLRRPALARLEAQGDATP